MTNTPAALPIATATLRTLIVLNWIYGGCLVALLAYSVIDPAFLLRALRLGSATENPGLVIGVRVIAALGLLAVPLNLGLLNRVVAMVQTVRSGNPFVAMNANRLQVIAWILLVQQLLSVTIGLVGKAVSTPPHPIHLGAGFSPSGWLAVILTFVLARVFAEGTSMRDDLDGTV